jgi:hypothetical protein
MDWYKKLQDKNKLNTITVKTMISNNPWDPQQSSHD